MALCVISWQRRMKVAFGTEADMNRQERPAASVANDPSEKCGLPGGRLHLLGEYYRVRMNGHI
jgi:hypothetical protein